MSDQSEVDILLVEDNARDAELTMRAFKKYHLANRIHLVEDGAEALDFIFARDKYATQAIASLKVVILDLKLPKVNGLEVLRAIKEDSRTQTTPVVVVTSSAEDPDVRNAYALGANSYVVKPVNFEKFMEAMRGLGFYWLLVNHPLVD